MSGMSGRYVANVGCVCLFVCFTAAPR